MSVAMTAGGAALVEVVPTGAALGAEVRGVDLRRLDDERFEAVHAAWLDHPVLLFRGQSLDDDELIAFSRRFGELDWAPVQETGRRFVEGKPEIYVVSNVVENGEPIGSLGAGEAVWHTDMSYIAAAAQGEHPLCARGAAVGRRHRLLQHVRGYEALPEALQAADRRAQESSTTAPTTAAAIVRQGVTPTDDPRTRPGTLHPLVCTHPETGRRVLYLGRRRNAYIVGLAARRVRSAARRDLGLTPRATSTAWTHRWRVGDLVLWDNRCTMHRRDPVRRRLAPHHAPHADQGRSAAGGLSGAAGPGSGGPKGLQSGP